jgi:hypothetical protein
VLNNLNREINIQIRPVEMPPAKLFDIEDFSDRSVLEPRKIFKSKEKLPVMGENPKPVF